MMARCVLNCALYCPSCFVISVVFFVKFSQSTARALLGDGTNNGGTSGQVAQVGACNFSEIRSLLPSPIIYLLQTGGASDFIKSSDLGDYVDAIIGPAPSGVRK
jgi:hypothetical protein